VCGRHHEEIGGLGDELLGANSSGVDLTRSRRSVNAALSQPSLTGHDIGRDLGLVTHAVFYAWNGGDWRGRVAAPLAPGADSGSSPTLGTETSSLDAGAWEALARHAFFGVV
jgi:hypothetical protein